MRSSELQAKVDAMEPEARKAYLQHMEELFAEVDDLVGVDKVVNCCLYPESNDRSQESAP